MLTWSQSLSQQVFSAGVSERGGVNRRADASLTEVPFVFLPVSRSMLTRGNEGRRRLMTCTPNPAWEQVYNSDTISASNGEEEWGRGRWEEGGGAEREISDSKLGLTSSKG